MLKRMLYVLVAFSALTLSACSSGDGKNATSGYWRQQNFCRGSAVKDCILTTSYDLAAYVEIRDTGMVIDLLGNEVANLKTFCEGFQKCTIKAQDKDHFVLSAEAEGSGFAVGFARVSSAIFKERRTIARQKVSAAQEALASLRGRTLVLDKKIHVKIAGASVDRSETPASAISDKIEDKDENGQTYVEYNAKTIRFDDRNFVLINNELRTSYEINLEVADAQVHVRLSVVEGQVDSGVTTVLGRIEVFESQVQFVDETSYMVEESREAVTERNIHVYNFGP